MRKKLIEIKDYYDESKSLEIVKLSENEYRFDFEDDEDIKTITLSESDVTKIINEIQQK